MIAFIIALLNGLAAIPKIAPYISQLVNGIVSLYVARQTQATLSAISDAAAFSARAESADDRFKAAALWQSALSQARWRV